MTCCARLSKRRPIEARRALQLARRDLGHAGAVRVLINSAPTAPGFKPLAIADLLSDRGTPGALLVLAQTAAANASLRVFTFEKLRDRVAKNPEGVETKAALAIIAQVDELFVANPFIQPLLAQLRPAAALDALAFIAACGTGVWTSAALDAMQPLLAQESSAALKTATLERLAEATPASERIQLYCDSLVAWAGGPETSAALQQIISGKPEIADGIMAFLNGVGEKKMQHDALRSSVLGPFEGLLNAFATAAQ